MKRLLALLLVALALPVAAHDVPFRTACSFDPLVVSLRELSMDGIGAAPTKAEVLRLTDATIPQSVQFNAATVPPRVLTGLGVTASLQLPPVFPARVLASGDFTATDVPLVLTIDGASTTVTVTLTTGLTPVTDFLAVGSPMSASGVFGLVGAARVEGLPAPYGGTTGVFVMQCATAPVPDVDKFPAVELRNLGGRITTKRVRLHAILDPSTLTADFSAPAYLHVGADGAAPGQGTLATVILPDGLTARGRRAWVGESADGTHTQRVVVRLKRKRPTPLYTVALRVGGPAPALPAGRPNVTLTSQVGGILARVTKPFRGTR
jgi:hypothetical protein